MISAEQVFLDANVVIAAVDKKDVLHTRALSLVQDLRNQKFEFYLSDVVVNETPALRQFAKPLQ